ncbi:ABC transporter permease subunit [Saccharopolyspora hattusasensis]|uniref:ABC transporter permease subunit n=1 Tax=Saccharopolyspora hattusasensis TaxID=1128679 RepID=UPI003D995A21
MEELLELRAQATSRSRNRTSHAWRNAVPLGILAVLYGVFFFWPIASIAVRSFNPDGASSLGGATLSNYQSIVRDPLLRDVIANTVRVSIISTLLTFVLAFPTAYLMSRLRRVTATVLLLLVLLPFWVSILVRLFVMLELLSTDGLVNSVLDALGIGRQSLLFNTTGTVIGMVNYLLPYMILIFYSAMSGVDTNLVQAAKSLGASSWSAFRKVYLPMVRNAVVGGVLVTFILACGFFLTPDILGGPKDVTVSTYMAQQVQNYQWGPASALGIALLVVTAVGFAVGGRLSGITGGTGVALGGTKGAARAAPMRFGPTKVVLWVMAGLVLIVLLVPLLLVFPLSWGVDRTITWPPRGFTLDWYRVALTDTQWTSSIIKSITVSMAVAALSLTLAVLAARAIAALRRRPTLQSILVSFLCLPLVAPVILLAIGTFDVQARIGAIGSWWGLVMVQTVLAMPYTYLVASAALANIDPNLEKAAWTMGASRLRGLWRVTLPLLVPALIGAALLAFINSWDEAVVALFQTSFDKTLPVNFYSFVKSGSTPVIAAIGGMLILFIVVAGALVLALNSRGRKRGDSAAAPVSSLEESS